MNSVQPFEKRIIILFLYQLVQPLDDRSIFLDIVIVDPDGSKVLDLFWAR